MTLLKTSIHSVVSGLASLGMISGWGAALGVAAIATATPAAACNSEPYIGSICTFAFDWCPRGYMQADGRQLAVREYTALFGTIGFTYGGDNTNNFRLPDLLGRTVIAKGKGEGLDLINLAQKVGKQSIVLSDSQVPLKAHTHTATFIGSGAGSKPVTVPASAGSLGVTSKLEALQVAGVAQPQTGKFLGMGGSGTQQAPIYATSTTTTTAVELGGLEVKVTGTAGHGAFQFDVPTGITGGTVSVAPAVALATAGVSTQSPGLGMTVCIAVEGLYPSRP
ncbi:MULTISPECIES: tail fiber protein [unclassified Rhizobium]|uniref:phage tail protein n=1 Tax=unclassified Rhizobium TaxID=2613769 RepID=UPI00288C408F|nr:MULTISPECIES: tail fiber protein [unclassified Rhizobium]